MCEELQVRGVYSQVINFAMQQNHFPIIQQIIIENLSDHDMENLCLELVAEPNFAVPFKLNISAVPAGKSICLKDLNLQLSTDFLSSVTEKILGSLSLKIMDSEGLLYSDVLSLEILAFDQWGGSQTVPEILAAFVTPNHPAISGIITDASALLKTWTGNGSLDEYQQQDPNRVRQQVAAVYTALLNQNITYITSPASFEKQGQRIRLVDSVLSQKLGTCLDITLLFASCLEAIGIHPIIVIISGHAFAGAWLTDEYFPEAVQDDMSLLTKRMASGMNTICAVECTAITADQQLDFEAAEKLAGTHLIKAEDFDYLIDVRRARISGIIPLPVGYFDGTKMVFTDAAGTQPPLATAPNNLVMQSLPEMNGKPVLSRKDAWERKLLDLSLRNNLINFRSTVNTIPILPFRLDLIEDALADGVDFQVLERPADIAGISQAESIFDQGLQSNEVEFLLEKELSQKRLRSHLSSGQLEAGLKGLYRKSRDAMEENGANILYLALGFLKWYETDSSQKSRYAPIILIPVDIVRKSAAFGYVVRRRDDEAQINITLLEMLKQFFGIQINGLDPIPSDEHGIHVSQILNQVRQAVMSKSRWDISEHACIGTFSFSRFVMWNDIHARADDLAQNKVVQSLMEGKLTFGQEPLVPVCESLDEICSPKDLLLATSADTSQLGAVLAASNGKSFVLHGPPGTGKSQTITNIICNSLAQGQSVLFVAEKMAALSVVQRRLDKLGLSPFCLELHSNKATKKAVLDQLQKASEVTKNKTPSDYEKEGERLQNQRQELNIYAKALYKSYPFGLTLYEAMAGYFGHEDTVDGMVFDPQIFAVLTAEDIRNREDLVSECGVVLASVGQLEGHPLTGINTADYSQQLREDINNQLELVITVGSELETLTQGVKDLLQINITFSSDSDYKLLGELVGLISGQLCPMSAVLTVGDIDGTSVRLRTAMGHAQKEQSLRREFEMSCRPEIFQLGGQDLLKQWQQNETKWIVSKSMSQSRILKLLNSMMHSQTSLNKAAVMPFLSRLTEYQQEKATVLPMMEELEALAGKEWAGWDTNWTNLLSGLELVERINKILLQLTGDPSKAQASRQAIARLWDGGQTNANWQTYPEIAGRWEILITKLQTSLGISEMTFPQSDSSYLSQYIEVCRRWQQGIGDLREWCTWIGVKNRALAMGLEPFVIAVEGGLKADIVLTTYQKALYKSCTNYIFSQDRVLASFSGVMFEEKIRRFKKTMEDLEVLTRKETFARLAASIPDFTVDSAQSSEVGVLKKAIRSNGRGVSIRSLFGQLPRLLPRLCPCMLMSPMSVAQYFDPAFKKFDLVIFDEASQITTSEAVGAIARGNNVVIVGDPKQLPPTSFFSADTTDEENLETEDLESILDDCLAISMPEEYLLWHYRSRHESLITFSNVNYYDNKLLTFPSPNNLVSKVTLVPVTGIYDRGRTRQNQAEAQAVVAEILRRLRDDELSQKSIGVVTFSSVQQNLIEDLLMEAYALEPELETKAGNCYEPIIIRNLENVQGDERDVILFSIGYGPDEKGYVVHNFGPLNRSGGWRRLNVAVTRARYEMIVYAVLKPEQLDLSRSTAQGVAGLKAFLEYAQKGTHSIAYRQEDVQTIQLGLNDAIAKALEAENLKVKTNIGSSNYKIDLAIVHPDKEDEFILGIMCNGKNYHSAKTAREREVLQQSVLEQLGWNIHTVWTPDWWDAPAKEVQKILQKLDSLQHQAEPIVVPSVIESPVKAQAPAQVSSETPAQMEDIAGTEEQTIPPILPTPSTGSDICQEYVVTQLPTESITTDEFCLEANTPKLLGKILRVLEVEAPVSRSLACKRVLKSCGITRLSPRLEQRFDELFGNIFYPTTNEDGTVFYWPLQGEPASLATYRIPQDEESKRLPEELPTMEIALAARHILKDQLSMTKADLARAVCRQMGYSRSGVQIDKVVELGMTEAKSLQWIKEDEGDCEKYVWI